MAKPASSPNEVSTEASALEARLNEALSLDKVYSSLPAVQEAVRIEIAARIAAGEQIASMSDADMQERSKAVLRKAHVHRTNKKSAA